jgi:hypothetical protein
VSENPLTNSPIPNRPGGLGPQSPPPQNLARPTHDLGRPAPRDSLVDLLDRVLDKGVVIAGDVSISLLDIELLTIKIRLLIASVDKAREMGIDWWANDPQLSGAARRQQQKLDAHNENKQLRERIKQLEDRLDVRPDEQQEGRARRRPRGEPPAQRRQPNR